MKSFIISLFVVSCLLQSSLTLSAKELNNSRSILLNNDTSSDTLGIPLAKGNRYQYRFNDIWNLGGSPGEIHKIVECSIVKDTTINGKKYFGFTPGFYPWDRLQRYDPDSNKYYIRIDSTDNLCYDFNMDTTNYGYFYSIWSINANGRVYSSSYIIDEYFVGSKWRTYYNFWDHPFYRNEESMTPGLGMTYYKKTAQNIGMSFNESYEFISAIIYDESGGYKYYHEFNEPQIVFTPFEKLDGRKTELNFAAEVTHVYNQINLEYNVYKDGIVYIDTVLCDYFYQKGDVKTDTFRIIGVRKPVTSTYSFTMPVDTFLIRHGYELKYSFTAKDKSLIPVYKRLPLNDYFTAVFDPLLSVNDEGSPANTFSLDQNYPNPFNPLTTISFSIAEWGPARMSLFNSIGQEVKVLWDKETGPGKYTISLDGSALTSGIYFCRLTSGSSVMTRKLVLLK